MKKDALEVQRPKKIQPKHESVHKTYDRKTKNQSAAKVVQI